MENYMELDKLLALIRVLYRHRDRNTQKKIIGNLKKIIENVDDGNNALDNEDDDDATFGVLPGVGGGVVIDESEEEFEDKKSEPDDETKNLHGDGYSS